MLFLVPCSHVGALSLDPETTHKDQNIFITN